MRKLIALGLILLITAIGAADTAFLRITPFPSASVADARTQVTLSAEIRLSNGRLVPDGTQVYLATTLGTLREPIVTTINGVARGTLTAPAIPGVAKITATAPAYGATTVLDFEFVGDRSLLSSARNYVEVVSPSYLAMSLDTRVITASGPSRGAQLIYKDLQIDADDVQYDVGQMKVKARKAILKLGKWTHEFDQLSINLTNKTGLGLCQFDDKEITGIEASGRYFLFETKPIRRFGAVQFRGTDLKPYRSYLVDDEFTFSDQSDATTTFLAKKAVVVPNREVQLHNVQVYVGTNKALKLPLYTFDLSTSSPVFASQIFNINENRIALNYPHYLSLKPGETSLLRFRTGDNYGRSLGGVNAFNLDYELNWRSGDEKEGQFSITGANRSDASVGFRQYLRLGERSSLSGQIDLPAHKSIFGGLNFSRDLGGAQLSSSANLTHNFRGASYDNQSISLAVERDPVRLGKSFQLYMGVTNDYLHLKTDATDQIQSSTGFRLRTAMAPQQLSSKSTMNLSASVARLFGRNVNTGLTSGVSLSISAQLGRTATALIGYDFSDDGLGSSIFGKHRLTLQGYTQQGRTNLSFLATRSIGLDRMNSSLDFGYHLNKDWRFSYSHTLSRYGNGDTLDYTLLLGFRLGLRELGLTWSKQTKKIGVQLFDARF